MRRITALEFQRNFGRIQDAAQREPIAVTHHGRDRTVVLSYDEYERLKRRDRHVVALTAGSLPEDFVAALRQPHHDPEAVVPAAGRDRPDQSRTDT